MAKREYRVTKLEISEEFRNQILKFSKQDKGKVFKFLDHVRSKKTTNGLPGRNKPSHEVPKDHPEWIEKAKYAQLYRSWHYHAGLPMYDTSKGYGDWLSEKILHYQFDEENELILLLLIGKHHPLKIPILKDFRHHLF